MTPQRKYLRFKASGLDTEQGVFEGLASVFGVLDTDGDIVEPGAFKKSLASGMAANGVPIHAQHDETAPIGKSLLLEEDEQGLRIKGYISPTRLGEDYRQLLKDGVIDAMSVGIIVIKEHRGDDGANHITEAELIEISLVTRPANSEARITNYKSQTQGGTSMDPIELFANMSTEDLSELAAATAEELAAREAAGDTSDEAQKSDDANGDPSEVEDQLGTQKADSQTAAAKSAANDPGQKGKAAAATMDMRRKYASIFASSMGTNREKEDKVPEGIGFARSIKCMMLANGDPERAASIARKMYGDGTFARRMKALTVTNPSGGGFLVPEVYAAEVIPLLRAKSIVRQLGATTMPMDNGNLTIPKMTKGAGTGYIGELRPGKVTQAEFGTVKLSAKKLMSLVLISNDLLRSNAYSADQIILNDVTDAMALEQDRAALNGAGTEYEPKGILKNKDITHIDLGVAGLSTLGTLHAAMMKKNANMDKLGWAMNPYGWEAFYNVANQLGVYPLRDQMDQQKLQGQPYEMSTQIPNQAANKTQVILGNWSDLLIGEQAQIEAEMFREGAVPMPDGKILSALTMDATILRVISLHDMAVRYAESFVVGELTLGQ